MLQQLRSLHSEPLHCRKVLPPPWVSSPCVCAVCCPVLLAAALTLVPVPQFCLETCVDMFNLSWQAYNIPRRSTSIGHASMTLALSAIGRGPCAMDGGVCQCTGWCFGSGWGRAIKVKSGALRDRLAWNYQPVCSRWMLSIMHVPGC